MRAVVLGGGVAGLLAASVLTAHCDEVTVVERDRYGDGSLPRKGVPQSRHAHLLLGSGADTIEALLPGTVDAMIGAGARRIGMPQDIFTLTPQGWMPRFPHVRYLLSASRTVLETALRQRILPDSGITVLAETDAVGLTGDAGRVTGARVRERPSGEPRPIDADLVVDATGASSKIRTWLGELGVPAPPEVIVDGGVGYATRTFRPPAELADEFPAVFVQPDPEGTGAAGVLLPVEGGRWIVSLAGMRGCEPPDGERAFTEFAEGLRHRLIADLMATAEPLTPVLGYRPGPNLWRRLDRMPRWPEGFVVLGDAACTFNPLYGHGMSVAAFGVRALRDELAHGAGDGFARRVQRAVAGVASDAWELAVGMDLRYEQTIGERPGFAGSLRSRFADRVGRAAAVDPSVTAALLDAYTLAAPLSSLTRPKTVLSVLRPGRGRPEHDTPPMTAREADLLAGAAKLGRTP